MRVCWAVPSGRPQRPVRLVTREPAAQTPSKPRLPVRLSVWLAACLFAYTVPACRRDACWKGQPPTWITSSQESSSCARLCVAASIRRSMPRDSMDTCEAAWAG